MEKMSFEVKLTKLQSRVLQPDFTQKRVGRYDGYGKIRIEDSINALRKLNEVTRGSFGFTKDI